MRRRVRLRQSATAIKREKEAESPRTIGIALLANAVIGIAKLIAGLMSGSTAMLAEAAHSGADCVNELFLAIGLHHSKRPPDDKHPFGHGRARFLWAFMAAIASFLIGGCVSIFLAVRELEAKSPVIGGLAPWVVLAVALVAESISLMQALRQARRQAKDYGLSVPAYVRRASDPVVRAVLVEDSAALAGLALAAGGLLLARINRSSVPDSIASLLIGILLAGTAFALAKPLADFLVGRSIPPNLLERLREMIVRDAAIEEVIDVRATYSGPEEVVVLAKARPSPKLDIESLSRAMDALDHRIRRELPFVADVFIDVTASGAEPRRAGRSRSKSGR